MKTLAISFVTLMLAACAGGTVDDEVLAIDETGEKPALLAEVPTAESAASESTVASTEMEAPKEIASTGTPYLPAETAALEAPAPVVKKAKRVAKRRPAKKAEVIVAKTEIAPVVAPLIAPEIPTSAKAKNGALLNRYYVLRKGDDAEKLAVFLYGDATRVMDLKMWNDGNKWVAGELVFYASPKAPMETAVLSFFEENNVRPRAHTVRQEDTLPQLAKETYGDEASWTEIAAVNRLRDARQIQPGTEVLLMPENLAAFAAPAKPAAVAEAATAPTVTPKVGTDGKKDPQLASPDLRGFFVRHLGVSMVLTAAFLFVAFLLLRRSSRNRDADF